MSEQRRNLLPGIVLGLFVVAASLVAVVRSAGKAPEVVTPESIGYIDLEQVYARFPEFTRLQEIRKAYENELNSFANYQRQSLATYLQELEKKKEEESAGKTEAQKQEIERKYDELDQKKATEIDQSIQQKNRELQDKLDRELAKAEERLRQVIETVGAEKGLNLVLVKSAIYYGGVDLTDDVIKKAIETDKK
ncbi:MAG: OmpH family outer membrane protein [Firmicutes bacterium]|nr:OmpH family outer membrane protein [Bacillota bacterium]